MEQEVKRIKVGFINYSKDGSVESANRKGIYSDESKLLAREINRDLKESGCVEILIQKDARIQVVKLDEGKIQFLELMPVKYNVEVNLPYDAENDVLTDKLAPLLKTSLEPYFESLGN